MIEVYTGNPGHGKSTYLARKAVQKLKQADATFKKTGKVRRIYSNLKFSKEIELKYDRYINYFVDLENISDFRKADIFIDEISLFFDSHNWESLPRTTKKFLRLHRHYGVNIYGATQDFKTVDPSFRRLVAEGNLYYFDRIWATREPDPDLPPLKVAFLLTVMRGVRFDCFNDEKIDYKYTTYSILLFKKRDFAVFDTHQEFSLGAMLESTLGYPDLRKVIQVCKDDGYTKVTYKEKHS